MPLSGTTASIAGILEEHRQAGEVLECLRSLEGGIQSLGDEHARNAETKAGYETEQQNAIAMGAVWSRWKLRRFKNPERKSGVRRLRAVIQRSFLLLRKQCFIAGAQHRRVFGAIRDGSFISR